jgi:hypothetical protein
MGENHLPYRIQTKLQMIASNPSRGGAEEMEEA